MAAVETSKATCPKCQAAVLPAMARCRECGHRLPPRGAGSSDSDATAAPPIPHAEPPAAPAPVRRAPMPAASNDARPNRPAPPLSAPPQPVTRAPAPPPAQAPKPQAQKSPAEKPRPKAEAVPEPAAPVKPAAAAAPPVESSPAEPVLDRPSDPATGTMIMLTCDCGRRLRAPKAKSGKSVKCPECGRLIEVPSVPGSADEREESRGSRQFRAVADEIRKQPRPSGESRAKPRKLRSGKLKRLVALAQQTGASHDVRDARCEALQMLGESGDPRAVEALKAIAGDPGENVKIREAAIAALGSTNDPELLPDLIELLDSPISDVRAALVTAIGKLKDRRSVRPLLQFGLEHPHGKYLCYDAILKLGDEAVLELLDVLNSSDPGMVLDGVVLLGRLECGKAVPVLVQILQTKTAVFRRHAAESLGMIGDRKALGHLIKLLKDDDIGVRLNAAIALTKIPDAQAVPALMAALTDEDEDIRIHVTQALGEIGDGHAAAALAERLEDPSAHVRIAAAEALGQCGDARAVVPLIEQLNSTDERIQLKTISALRRFRDPRTIAALLPLLHHANDVVRQRVVDTLGQIGDAEIAQRLELILKHDRSELVRASAAKALGDIGDPGSIDPLLDALQDQFPVKCRAIVSLGAIHDESALPAIIALLRDPVPETRFHAVGALTELAPLNAVALLEPLFEDSSSMVRRGVGKALQKFNDPRAEELINDTGKSRRRRNWKQFRTSITRSVLSLVPNHVAATMPGSQAQLLAGLTAVSGLVLVIGLGYFVATSPLFRSAPATVLVRGLPQSASVSTNGAMAVIPRTTQYVEIVDSAGRLLHRTKFDTLQGAFADNDQSVALITANGLSRWKFGSEESPGAAVPGHKQLISSGTFSNDRKVAATLDEGSVAVVWDLSTTQPVSALQLAKDTNPSVLAVSSDGKIIATVDRKQVVSLWDVTKAALLIAYPPEASPVTELHFTPDNSGLLIYGGGKARLRNVSSGKDEEWPGLPQDARNLSLLSTGKAIVCISGQTVMLWEADSKKSRPLYEATGALGGVSVSSSDSHAIAWGAENSGIYLIDLKAGKLASELEAP